MPKWNHDFDNLDLEAVLCEEDEWCSVVWLNS